MPTFFLELMYSHVLLFSRNKASKYIGKSLKLNMDLIQDFSKVYSSVHTDFRLQDFPLYGSRLQNVQRKMNEWRPQTITELAVRPYQDPLTFYAFWFATFFGTVSILGLGASIVQAVVGIKSLHLQMQQMNVNVN